MLTFFLIGQTLHLIHFSEGVDCTSAALFINDEHLAHRCKNPHFSIT